MEYPHNGSWGWQVITLRILHIWNTAGCASIIAKFMDRLFPTKSWVVTRSKSDSWGLTIYGETLKSSAKVFTLRVLLRARNYDLIQVHAVDKLVPWMKRLYPKKPVVMHYAGSNIRQLWDKRKQYWEKADLLLVSTSDLLEGAPDNAIWLPNPVDTDLFYARAHVRLPKHAFHISHDADDLAIELAKKHNLELTIRDRSSNPIPYVEMGEVLSSYEYYIDVKRSVSPGAKGQLIQVLSKTGLEALACGTKVICWNGEIIEELLPQHHPNNVVTRLWNLYSQLKLKR